MKRTITRFRLLVFFMLLMNIGYSQQYFQMSYNSTCLPTKVNITGVDESFVRYELQIDNLIVPYSGKDTAVFIRNPYLTLIAYDAQDHPYYDYGYLDGYDYGANLYWQETACPESPVNFQAYGNSGNLSGTWTINNQTYSNSYVDIVFPGTGRYPVYYTGTASCGAVEYTGFINIVDTLTPNPYLHVNNDSICVGEVTSFNVSGGTGNVTWDFGDGTIKTGEQWMSHSYAATGVYTVKATVSNTCGNSATTEAQVWVGTNVTPSEPNLHFPDSACPNQKIYFSANSDYQAYNWYFGEGTTRAGQYTEYTYTEPGVYNVTLTVKNKCNISRSVTKSIEIKGNIKSPIDLYIDRSEICPGEKISFSPYYTDFYKSFIWSFGDGNTSHEDYPRHSWSGPGTYDVTLTATNYCNVQSTITRTISVSGNAPDPYISVDGPGFYDEPETICFGEKVNWWVENEQFSDIVIDYGDGKTGKSLAHVYATAGNYYPKVSLTTFCGRTHTVEASSPIQVKSQMTTYGEYTGSFDIYTLSDVEIFCPSEPVVFIPEDVPGNKFLWDFGDGSPIVEKSTPELTAHTYSTAGNYSLELTVYNNCGADTTLNFPVTVGNRTEAYVELAEIESDVFCPNDIVIARGYGASSYSWDFGDGSPAVVTGEKAYYGGQLELDLFQHKYTSPGNYTISLNATDYCGNVYQDQFNVSVVSSTGSARSAEVEAMVFDNETLNTCSNIGFFVSSGASFKWDFQDGSAPVTTTEPVIYHTFKATGYFYPSVEITNGCSEKYTITESYGIFVDTCTSPTLKPDFVSDKTIGQPPLTVQFSDKSTASGNSVLNYMWDFNNDGTVDATVKNPTFTFNTPGKYTVKLTISDGTKTESIVKTDYITVFTCTDLKAGFQADPVCLGTETLLRFNSQVPGGMTGATYKWDVGNDGTVDYTTPNATHMFGAKGEHPVKLVVSTDICKDSIVKNAVVQNATVSISTLNAAICETDTIIPVTGTIEGSNTGVWKSSGAGTFRSTAIAQNAYRVAFEDRQAGFVWLKLSSDAPACATNMDSVRVQIIRRPIVHVGPNKPLSSTPVAVDATVLHATQVFWTSSGSGAFEPSQTAVDITYAPSAEDITDGTVRLSLVANNGVCPPVANRLVLSNKSVICNVTIAKTSNAEKPNLYTFAATNDDKQTVGSYKWDFGDGTTASGRIQSNVYNKTGKYIIQLSYSSPDSSCIATAYDSVNITAASLPTFSISGTVKASGNLIDKGRVTLFKFDGYYYDYLRVTDVGTSTNGAYSFTGLENGYYLIHALPDTSSAYFNGFAAAYYGDASKWEDGKFIWINNGNESSINVNLIPFTPGTYNAGTDKISGTIVFDQETANARIMNASETPVENAVVTLYNSSGDRLTSTYTDPFGNYSFDDLGAGEYFVDVEYAGTEMGGQYKISANGNGQLHDGNLVVTKQQVAVGTVDKKEPVYTLHVYPNPVRDYVKVSLPDNNTGNITIKVYNVSGVLYKEVETLEENYVLQVSDLNEGMYIINVESSSGKWIAKFNKF